MRHLTTITGKSTTESFVAYLLTQDISTHVEQAGDINEWDIWIRDEDRLEVAKKEYQQFIATPDDEKYRNAVDQAKAILKEQKQKSAERQKNVQHPSSRAKPGAFGGSLPPLTLTLILLCVFLGVVSSFTKPEPNNWLGNYIMKQLSFVDLNLYNTTRDPAASLKHGELWRIFTPAFLHGSTFHLLFNMLALGSLGRTVERLEGSGRYALAILIIAMCSHLLQGLMPTKWFGSPFFVGISGVVFGLVGYLGMKTTLRPDLGIQVPAQTYLMVALILVIGFYGDSKSFPLANLGHLGGLMGGVALGFLMSDRRFDRSRR